MKTPFHVELAIAGFLFAFASSAFGDTPPLPHDDQKARYVNFEVGPVRSVLLDVAGGRLLVLNQEGNRLAIFDPITLERRAEIPIALGGASMAQRPGTQEVWVVDRVYGTVQVVDLVRQAVVRSIRVGAEPHGIAFSLDGARAWVACSADDTVAAIDATTYTVASTLAIPADAPRGVAFHRGSVWVTSFLSGNGTAARGTAMDALRATDVAHTDGPGLVPLPDLDVFPIRVGGASGNDFVDLGQARSGAGTILFDVVGRPGTNELWIPGTDALNAEHRGEESFVAGRVVSNRIAIFDVEAPLLPPRIVDLDALAPAGVRCAQPTGLAFDPIRTRVYVCAYGSDLVAVLNVATNGTITWAGHVVIPPKQVYPRGSGPRSCVVDPFGQNLWVFSRNDHSIVRVSLATLPVTPNFAITAPTPVPVGFDASSDEILLGRHLFTDARNSASKTSSCASCHVDGNTDNLVWELSQYVEPEGTPLAQTLLGLDVKGPLLTQGTRRQEETAPYHWRGEKHSLNEFDAAFATLLDRTNANGQAAPLGGDFQYLRHYINRIAIPANPRQQRDRRLRPEEAAGLQLFRSRPVLGNLTCVSCHTLPLGSNGEVAIAGVSGIPGSFDVPHLRGVGDREQPEHDVGGAFGARPRGGAGLTHGGVFARLEDTFARPSTGPNDLHAFALSPSEAQSIAAFLRAFDTGLAPSTAWMATAHAANWAAVRDDDVVFLLGEARRGNCDLAAFRSQGAQGPRSDAFARTATYDVARDTWMLAGGPLREISTLGLLAEAAAGRPVTFLGVPLGMGLTAGMDRDADGILDVDEKARGTNPDSDDTDGDRYPDGYELQHGNNPLVAESTIADSVAPTLVGPVRVIYATSNTVKVEFRTSETCRVHVALNGGAPLQRLPLGQKGDTLHFVLLTDLEPDTEYVLNLELRDSATNVRMDSTTRIRTAQRILLQPTYAADIRLALAPAGPTLVVEVDVANAGAPVGAGYEVRGAVYRSQIGQPLPQVVAAAVDATTDASGRAVLRVPVSGVTGAPGTLYFVLTDVVAPPGGVPYARALSTEVFASIAY